MKSPRELPSGQAIGFAKMHGLGNDYVYVDGAQHHVNDPPALARWVSDRHVGIGSDGLIMVDAPYPNQSPTDHVGSSPH